MFEALSYAGMAHVTVVRLLHEHASSAHQAQGNGSKKLHYKHDCAFEVLLKASYTSSLRPHTLVAEGRIHKVCAWD